MIVKTPESQVPLDLPAAEGKKRGEWGERIERLGGCDQIRRRIAFPIANGSVWDTIALPPFLCVILEFSKISHWSGCGKTWAVAVRWQAPLPPEIFLHTGLGRARTRLLSQPPSGRMGYATVTLQPLLASSHSHLSERFSKTQEYFKQKCLWGYGMPDYDKQNVQWSWWHPKRRQGSSAGEATARL